MSRADKAGFGNKNRVSLIVGLWSMSAARCSKAAIYIQEMLDVSQDQRYIISIVYAIFMLEIMNPKIRKLVDTLEIS